MSRTYLPRPVVLLVVLLAACSALGLAPPASGADATYQWDKLIKVERIAVICPFYCTEGATCTPADEKQRVYQQTLQTLVTTLQKTLPQQLSASERFHVAPMEMTERHLRALHWTAHDLFTSASLQKGAPWLTPDPKRIATLAKRLHVDAILVGVMREPASISDGYQFHHEWLNPNPLNWSMQHIRTHVVSPRVKAFLINANAETVWKDEQMADHPRTQPRTMRTLQVDWQEATEQVAQQLADSLTRLPPPESPAHR